MKQEIKSFLMDLYEMSEPVAIFCIFMFIFETFMPLGDIVREYLGIFGVVVGQLLAVWGLVGIIHFILRKLN